MLADPETDVAGGYRDSGAAMCVRDVNVQCVLQFTLSIAFCCALHRHASRVIHRLEWSFFVQHRSTKLVCVSLTWSLAPGGGRAATASLFDLWKENRNEASTVPCLEIRSGGPRAMSARRGPQHHRAGSFGLSRHATCLSPSVTSSRRDWEGVVNPNRFLKGNGFTATVDGHGLVRESGDDRQWPVPGGYSSRASGVRTLSAFEFVCVQKKCSSEAFVNDPSAGSPTETLLRLLLPLDARVWISFLQHRAHGSCPLCALGPIQSPHSNVQSVVATGGVYKGQGRNQREFVTRAYWEFLVRGQQLQSPVPITKEVQEVTRSFRTGRETLVDSFSVARVRPRTSKGITDLLLLNLAWLKAICPSKKFHWQGPTVPVKAAAEPYATLAHHGGDERTI